MNKRVAVGLEVAAAASWALGGVLAIPGLQRSIDPGAMAAARVLLAGVLLFGIVAAVNRSLLRFPGHARTLACHSLAIVSVTFFYYASIDLIPVAVTLALQSTAPVMLLAWSLIVHRRRPSPWAIVAGVASFAGAVVISGALSEGGSLDTMGVVLAVASAAAAGAFYLTSRSLAEKGVASVTMTLYGFAGATILWTFLRPWWNWPLDALTDTTAVVSVVGVTLFGTLIPFYMSAVSARVLPAFVIGLAACTEPVFGALFAWIGLDQSLTLTQIIGGSLIIASVVLVELIDEEQHTKPAVTSSVNA